MIEIDHLSKEFTRNTGATSWWRNLVARPETTAITAIDDLSISIDQGQFFSLLGPNGAGKTSTVRVLCTLLLPDAGACRVAGYDVVDDARAVRRNIGVSIRGERSVYWKLSGRQNLEYFATLYGIRGTSLRQRVAEVTELIGLTDRIDDFVERYSMGMKQRLAIGASLLHRPPVLMLDEPTIGLDPNGARALRSLLKELCHRDGVTVLYTTHHMQEAEELSDRLAIINEGKMIVEGTPTDVRDSLGDNRIVELEVQGPGANAIAALEDHPLVSSILAADERASTTTIRVQTVEPLASVAPISDIANVGEIAIRSISLARPTLEDVFVTLTGSVITEAGDAETV